MASVGRFGTTSDESTHEYVLFAWGANSYGQLGLDHANDIKTPRASVSRFTNIAQLDGGGGHSMLITDGGQLFCCGWNKYCQTGIPQQQDKIMSLTNVQLGVPCTVTKVSCGWNHSIVLTNGTYPIVCGSNSHGQLGLPEVQDHTVYPRLLPNINFCDNIIIDVACGLRHSIAVTVTGDVYTWGSNKRGQLGHGKGGVSNTTSPKLVDCLRGIKCVKASAMAYNTVLCTENGIVYLCGCNNYGQCASSPMEDDMVKLNESGTIISLYVPCNVKLLPPVIQVSCGWSHIFVTCKDGRVFGWGRRDYGQLGIITDKYKENRFVPVPTEIEALNGIKQIACGSEHNIAISKNNELLSWGWNEHGMCGTGDDQHNILVPTRIPLTNDHTHNDPIPILVAAGAGHSMIVTRNNV